MHGISFSTEMFCYSLFYVLVRFNYAIYDIYIVVCQNIFVATIRHMTMIFDVFPLSYKFKLDLIGFWHQNQPIQLIR